MATADTTGIDPKRAQALAQAENARFVAQRPRSMARPTLSVAHGPDDVDRHVATFDDFLTEVT